MITYIVRSKRYWTDLSPATLGKASNIIISKGLNLTAVIGEIFSGNPSLKGYDEDLQGLFCREEHSERTFNEGTPIESRRAAFSYATNLNEVIETSGAYKDVVSYIQGASSNVYDISVFMRCAGEEHLIRSMYVNAEMLETWAYELSIYEANGYSIGAEQPFTKYVPEIGKVITVLPDMATYFI
jgi:hypothetical protein